MMTAPDQPLNDSVTQRFRAAMADCRREREQAVRATLAQVDRASALLKKAGSSSDTTKTRMVVQALDAEELDRLAALSREDLQRELDRLKQEHAAGKTGEATPKP